MSTPVDVRTTLRRLLATFQECAICGVGSTHPVSTATRVLESARGEKTYLCDHHPVAGARDLPIAGTLREALAFLSSPTGTR